MQQLSGSFDKFREAIEPDPRYKKHAQKADDPVREHLASHPSFAKHHVDTFLYGSYRRNTAVGNIKDVDLVVVTNFTLEDNPLTVLRLLKDSLRKLYDEPKLVDQRRSVRVDRPLPDTPTAKLTLDVIPTMYQDPDDPGGPMWVPDRELKCWIPSHPKAHLQYASDLSTASTLDHGFVRLTKMVKWWWQYQFAQRKPSVESHERKPKGFWVEVMTGEYADLSLNSYPELLVSLFTKALRTFRWDQQWGQITSLPDPGLANYPDPTFRTIKTSMTKVEFRFFTDVMEESLGWAQAALNADTEKTASEYWRKVFGPSFLLVTEESVKSLLSQAYTPSGLAFPDKPVLPQKPGGFA